MRNEVYVCHDESPGGCATSRTMFTPALHLMYTTVEVIRVNLSDGTHELNVDVEGIEGDFYGMISREDFGCGIWQPEQYPEGFKKQSPIRL